MATHEPMMIAPTPPTLKNFMRNLRDLPQTIALSGIVAGFIVVLISYTGPLLIILQAAENANLTPEQTSSWVWTAIVGNGIGTILLSLLFRMPLMMPYSTSGAALLTVSLMRFPFSDAVGAYIITALALALLGMSGLFGRLMRVVPQPVVLALLGGVLLRFGIAIFNTLDDTATSPFLVIAMVVAFFFAKRMQFRAPTLLTLIVGVIIVAGLGELHFEQVEIMLTVPQVVMPTFSLDAVLSLSLPLFALALSSQYAPGLAVLRANHYDAPINGILTITGLLSAVYAFFGSHGNCLGALTAAIVVGPDGQPDPDKRYGTAVASGVWHIILGLFGATIIGLFRGFPPVFVATIAGLSFVGVIASSLGGALEHPQYRDAAIVTFLCTAADFTLLGIGAPFWGLIAGVLVYALMRPRKPAVASV